MQGAPPTPSRRYVPPRSTSVSAVLEAALRIADGEGLEALSMRRLAADLGVGAMTLYRYVATKDELFDKMVVAVLGDLGCAPRPRVSWRQQLTEVTAEVHNKLRTHPGVTEIILTRVTPTPAFDRYRESILAILREPDSRGGRRRRIDVVDLLRDRIRPCRAVRRTEHDDEESRRLAGLSRQQYPNLTRPPRVSGHLRRGLRHGAGPDADGLERQRWRPQ